MNLIKNNFKNWKNINLNLLKLKFRERRKIKINYHPLKEIVSIKAQLAELNELKLKIKELENLKIQVEQITSNKNKKKDIKSLGRLDKKRKIIRKKIDLNKNKEEENNNDNNIILDNKTEQTFVNGDIIHSIDEFELLIRKMNKSSKKMTLNLIYKASIDSDRAVDFHKKCDNARETLVLIETNKGKRLEDILQLIGKVNALIKWIKMLSFSVWIK